MTELAPVAVQYLARLAPGQSRSTMARRVEGLAKMLGAKSSVDIPWHKLSVVEVGVIRGELERRYAPHTANSYLTALRGVLKAAWRAGLLSADAYERLTDFRPIPGGAVRQGRCLTRAEIRRLMGVAHREHGAIGVRNRAMLAVMLEGGLRKSEVSRLRVGDYQRGALHVVRSKHGRTRVVPLDRSQQFLARWLDTRGLGEGALFSKLGGGHLSPDMVDQIIKGFLREADLGDVTLHDLRRTMISTLLARGNDLAIAARIAGHADARTTQVYDRRPEEAARAAVKTMELPL